MHRKLHSLCFAALLALTPPAFAQEQGAQAELSMGSCESVARIYETLICREDIELTDETFEDMKAQYEASGVDPEQALEIRSLERVGNAIWDAALAHEFGNAALDLSPEDIKAYNVAHNKSLDDNYESDKQTLKEVENALAQEGLSSVQKVSLKQLQATLLTSIRFYNQRAQQREELPPEFVEMMAEAEYEMAKGFLRQWTIAKLLYDKYGGDVVMISGRMEPVGAYLAFLDGIEQQDSFEIYDADYKNALDVMRGRWEDMRQGKKVDTERAKTYFSSPLSQFDD